VIAGQSRFMSTRPARLDVLGILGVFICCGAFCNCPRCPKVPKVPKLAGNHLVGAGKHKHDSVYVRFAAMTFAQ
jgi:hypothetical protein